MVLIHSYWIFFRFYYVVYSRVTFSYASDSNLLFIGIEIPFIFFAFMYKPSQF